MDAGFFKAEILPREQEDKSRISCTGYGMFSYYPKRRAIFQALFNLTDFGFIRGLLAAGFFTGKRVHKNDG